MTFALLALTGTAAVAWLAWAIKQGLKYDTAHRLHHKLKPHVQADVKYPGHMAHANRGGDFFHGCRVGRFRTVEDINKFFEPGAEGHLMLVTDIIPQLDGSLLVVYTAALSQSDMENIEEFSRNQNAYFQERRQQREAERREAEEARLKEEAEQKRLAEVGRKYEERVGKIRGMPPGFERKQEEKRLNSGELE